MAAQDQPNYLEGSAPQPGLSTPLNPTSTLQRDDPSCRPSDVQNRLTSPLMNVEQIRTKQGAEDFLSLWAERIISENPYTPLTRPSLPNQSTMAMEQSNDLHTEEAEKNFEDRLAWAKRIISENPYTPLSRGILSSNQSTIPCCCTHNEEEVSMEKLSLRDGEDPS